MFCFKLIFKVTKTHTRSNAGSHRFKKAETLKQYVTGLNRRVPNGTHGDARGGSKISPTQLQQISVIFEHSKINNLLRY